MHTIEEEIRRTLLSLADPDYKKFQCALMPGVDPDAVIGVRMPALRKLAAKYAAHPSVAFFLNSLPHRYYEENNLHGVLISQIKSYEETVASLEAFLPCVDNWATCDLLRPRAFRAHPDALPTQIMRWMENPHPYTVRFAMEMLMVHYLGETYDDAYPAAVAACRREEYYVQMMQAWYFATALALRWQEILPYLAEHRLDPRVHAMTVRKACESFRITVEQKAILRTVSAMK